MGAFVIGRVAAGAARVVLALAVSMGLTTTLPAPAQASTTVPVSATASATTPAPATIPLTAPATDGTTTTTVGAAATSYMVTFVNHSGQTIWIGSGVNADGSQNLTGLPTLAPGQSATVAIPMTTTDHWRGKFFARQFCSGTPGSDFRCLVGDCGIQADRCTTGEQPASLAEFNFDRADRLAPWYNVSYVNAFSLPITISPDNAPTPPAGGGECEVVGCSTALLAYCPPENLTYRPGTRERMLCTNPNRDAATSYSNAITAHCPKAYAWSKQDTVPGNKVMRQCAPCTGFTITFYPPGTTEQAMPRGDIPGFAAKCVDVAGANPADRTQVQLYRCNGSIAQQWTIAPDGTVRALGKCLDVDGGGTGNGTRVQLYTCNNSAAQQWRYTSGRDIVNPQANKCLDVKDVNPADGTPLHLWDCLGAPNQKWSFPT